MNSIFSAKHYPDNFREVESLMEISPQLGTVKDLEYLINVLHEKNISLILDLPLYPIYQRLQPPVPENLTTEAPPFEEFRRVSRSLIDDNIITNVMRYWLSKGVDGFYLKGLENFADDQYLGENLREWKYVLGKDRIMIVNESLIKSVSKELIEEMFKVIDLVDVYLDISNGTQFIEKFTMETLNSTLKPSEFGPWVHWSMNGIDKINRVANGSGANVSLAGLLMELMLPGTPSIFYGDEISMEHSSDPTKEHEETKHMHHAPTMSFNDQYKFTGPRTLPWLPKSAGVSYDHLQYVTEGKLGT